MPLFTLQEIAEVTGARVLAGEGTQRPAVRRVSTDSRAVRPGDIFVALKGDRYDGHQFVDVALQRGAVAAIVQERSSTSGPTAPAGILLEVENPLLAYQRLAAHHRRRFDIPVIAVTGSNGKTTTKEMVARVLGERWRVLKTEANFNNQVGVPQTLLRLSARHQAAVIEMGVDAKGQTARLTEAVHPTVGVITNIGQDHLEFFGTLEASADSKAELLDLLPKDGVAVLNADDPYFATFASRARCQVISFGLARGADVRAEEIKPDGGRGMTFRLLLPNQRRTSRVALHAYGQHNVQNALAAAAVGHSVGVSAPAICRGLSRFRPATMRSEVQRSGSITIVNDCYNANPPSMRAAISLLIGLADGRRSVAVLGDMLELGPEAATLHREVGAHLARCGVSLLIACGSLGSLIADGAEHAGLTAVHRVSGAVEAAGLLKGLVKDDDVVLVKASRGMRLERVVDALKLGKTDLVSDALVK